MNSLKVIGLFLLIAFTSCRQVETHSFKNGYTLPGFRSNFDSVTKWDANATQDCFKKTDFHSIDSTQVKKVLKRISVVKEVEEFSKLHEDTISYCVVDYNYKNEGVYKIVVGLDFQTHFSTQFVFYANRNNDSLKILEVVRDTIMTIDEWRNASWLK